MAVRRKKNRITGALFAMMLAGLLVLSLFSAVPAEAAQAVSFPVEVSYSGKDLPEEVFRVELTDARGRTAVEEITLTGSAPGGRVTFSPALEEGTHTFTLRLIPGSTPGMEYSTKTYRVTIRVDSRGNAAITAADGVTGNPIKSGKLAFENRYTAPRKVTGDPPVTVRKKIEGDKPGEDQAFVFLMEPEDASWPLPEGAVNGRKEVTVLGEGEVEIGDITFYEPGVYSYRVYEKNEAAAGYTYDTSNYRVVYTVTEGAGGALSCQRNIFHNRTEPVNACTFTNEYSQKNAEEGDGSGKENPSGESSGGNKNDGDPSNGKSSTSSSTGSKSSGRTSGTTSAAAKTSPKTGDTTHPTLYRTLMIGAGMGAALCLAIRRKQEEEDAETHE